MNRDQLRIALGKAVERHARTLQDQGGRAGPALLDDLERVADEHAVQHAGKVTARKELRAEAATTLREDYGSSGDPVLVAASPDPETAVTETPSGVARTRTRTRGGPK